jgi:hypothetical protein
MVITPIYRVRVFAPRSVDPTETTLLTPRAGGLHADPFRIATARGVAGYQPYMAVPKGRRGRVDPISKKTDIGARTVTEGSYGARAQRAADLLRELHDAIHAYEDGDPAAVDRILSGLAGEGVDTSALFGELPGRYNPFSRQYRLTALPGLGANAAVVHSFVATSRVIAR